MEGKPGMLLPSYFLIEKWMRSLVSPYASGLLYSSSSTVVSAYTI